MTSLRGSVLDLNPPHIQTVDHAAVIDSCSIASCADNNGESVKRTRYRATLMSQHLTPVGGGGGMEDIQ